MQAASACAVSSPAAASGTCRPPPTTCASYTGSLSAAPDQPQHGTPPTTGLSSKPLEACQGRLITILNRHKRPRPAIQQQAHDIKEKGSWCRMQLVLARSGGTSAHSF